MADLNDILGEKKQDESLERIELDGMCGYQIAFGESCFFPLDYGLYDKKNKKLTTVCIKEHELKISWDMEDG